MSIQYKRSTVLRKGQRGAVTMFSAILILILLTEMIFYAVQVGVFEQRKSSNELSQKQAFHAADSAIQQAKQFMSANIENTVSTAPGGWLEAGAGRWVPCDTGEATEGTDPCFGEPLAALRGDTYFYSVGGSNELPIDPDALSASGNEKVTLHALLCMLDIDRSKDPIVQGCTQTAPADPNNPQLGEQDSRYYMITLLARGEADCDDSGNNCGAEALIADKIGSFGPGGRDGGPGAPLTSRTNVPLSGTVNLVPNPNGGGVGVPISSWVNTNTTDPECGFSADEEAITPESGSYETCERHEWYGQSDFTDDYKCPTSQCQCKRSEGDRVLSYADNSGRHLGIDIVPDPDFPCDLFEYTFGYDKQTEYQIVKGMVPTGHVLTTCDGLDETSKGWYWISGDDGCKLPEQVGSKDGPVFLVAATKTVGVSAHTDFYGVLMVTDAEYDDKGWTAECSKPGNATVCGFTGNGGGDIFGAVIMDAEMKGFGGNFSIVYVDDIVNTATETGGYGPVAGGWTDVHAAWK